MQTATAGQTLSTNGSNVRSLRILDRRYPVLLPSWSDSRLHVAATIITLHVLGQVWFGFELAVSQILAALLTCAAIEMSVTFTRARVIAWPASALLTGNGIAFLLRVPGTRAGDLWTWHGVGIYVAVAATALLTKHLVRVGDRPLFNPSNVALVGVFVLLGSGRVDPLDLWWGPVSPALVSAYLVIVVGGLVVGRRQGMLGATAAFGVTFTALMVPLSASGHCMSARWALGDVCGSDYFSVVVFSPELLIFAFFMITDPKTAPAGRVARIVYGAGVGAVAVLLAAGAHTEFWTKVSVLAALVIGCLVRPLIDHRLPAGPERTSTASGMRTRTVGFGLGALALAALVAVLLSTASPPSPPAAARAGDEAGSNSLPAVRLGADLTALGAGRPDQVTAERIVRDVLADLTAQGRVTPGQPVTDVVLTVVRDPSRPQDRPRLAVRLTRASGPEIHEVAMRAGHYHVVGRVPAAEPVSPATARTPTASSNRCESVCVPGTSAATVKIVRPRHT